MLAPQIEKNLFDIFFEIGSMPGWLADCVAAGFSKEEIDYLDHLGDEFLGYPIKADIAAWDREIEREGGPDIYFAETDDLKISLLSGRLADIYRAYERSMWDDQPYADRFMMLKTAGVDRLEKLRRSIRGRQLHKTEMEKAQKTPGYISDRITDNNIERARAYPLEKLVADFDMSKYGYIRCRWHDDTKPSMLIKNGFGYCFSCAKSIDAIGWLMDVDKMSFVDSVKYLRSKG